MKRDKRLKRYADKLGVDVEVLTGDEEHEWRKFANLHDAKRPIGLPPLPRFYFSKEDIEWASKFIAGAETRGLIVNGPRS
jgi:hypothetical protein